MTTYLGKSCSFCLPRVPFVNCRQFMYLVISFLVLRAGYGIWLYQFLIIAYLFTLIRLGRCPGWSESLLGVQVILLVLLCGSSILIILCSLKTRCEFVLQVKYATRFPHKFLTCSSQGAQGILIQCESIFKSMSPHIFVENITSSEIQQGTKILIMRYQSAMDIILNLHKKNNV